MSALVPALLSGQRMQAWGWRLPFLTALPLAVVGLLLRNGVEAIPAFLASREAGEKAPTSPARKTLRTRWHPLLLSSAGAMTNAVLSYLPATCLPQWLETDGALSGTAAFTSHAVALAAFIPLLAAAGRLSDRIDRRPLLLLLLLLPAGCVCTVVLVPLSFRVAHGRTFGAALDAQLRHLVTEFCIAVARPPEKVPTRLRVTVTALRFNVPSALFAGTTPMIATALVGRTGPLYSACLCPGGLTAISFAVLLRGLQKTAQEDFLAAVPPESLSGGTAPAPPVSQEG